MYDLFSDLFDAFDLFSQPMSYGEEKKCHVCGRTFSDFRRTGKFGCGECYKTFRTGAENVLRNTHSTTKHTGKIPEKSGDEIKKQRRYSALKAQLQDAVQNENYELAAKLHKEIRSIEDEK